MTNDMMKEMMLMTMLMILTTPDVDILSAVVRPMIPWTRYNAPTQ